MLRASLGLGHKLSFGLLTLGEYYKFAFIPYVFVEYPTVCWSQGRGEDEQARTLPSRACMLIREGRQVNGQGDERLEQCPPGSKQGAALKSYCVWGGVRGDSLFFCF